MDSCLFSKTFLEYIFHHSAYYDRQFLIVRVFILSILLCFPPLFKDPKGDESRMLSLWLSGCPKERVWQESSEWHYLLFVCCLFALSPPRGGSLSCSSGSKVLGVVSLLFFFSGAFTHCCVNTKKLSLVILASVA